MSAKVITEATVRKEMRFLGSEPYRVPAGKLLSPAAKEYLNQQKKDIVYEDMLYGATKEGCKPEHMTHLDSNTLVPKDHPRIIFRGKLDSLQSEIILAQTFLAEAGGYERLVQELSDIVKVLMEVMRCDACGEEMREIGFLGLTHEELRAHSHDPQKYYQVKQMIMPDYTMGKAYALINRLRTKARETEICAVKAFWDGTAYQRKDIVVVLNRLSSAMHIIMCRMLAGYYQ